MHKIPKGFIIIFFIFFLVIFPTLFLTNQYSSMFQTFLISLFASCFSALFYYMIFLGIKQLFKFFKGKPENRTIKPDSSRNVIMTEPVTDISLESVNCTSKCNHSKFEPQKEKSTHSYQDTSLLLHFLKRKIANASSKNLLILYERPTILILSFLVQS